MLITRGIEERGHILYKQGKIPGSFYTGRGNEASAVGVATAMGPDDVGTPLHRDMGVHVTRGVEPWRIFAQYMGREDGPTRAGTATSTWPTRSSASSPWSATCPRCCLLRSAVRSPSGSARRSASPSAGSAKAHPRAVTRTRDEPRGVRRLPVVFICDNNQWAYSTPTHLEYACETLADRAQAYGFEEVVVDGTDVLAVYREAKRAIEKAREAGARR